jgi:putative acetyltransferase
MLIIRAERVEDRAAISEVNRRAFGGEGEARLVEKIREGANFNPELSLVAIKDGEVVGYVLFSDIIIQGREGDVPALALSPLAVSPEFQNQGIGSELVRRGLRECRRLRHKVAVVLGHPNYYTRFGFFPGIGKGISAPFPVPDQAFMVL